jgi:RNA polymerase sigma-70 factor (ECF subfamily)
MTESDTESKDDKAATQREETPPGEKKKKTFWETVPGILAGIAGVLTAIGGLITVLVTIGVLSKPPEPTPTPTPVPLTEMRVIKTAPELGAVDVDPALEEIVITFSQPVMQGSYSFVAHPELGETPETTGDPHFPDLRTCVLPVRLEAGKTYAIGINGPDHRNFVSLNDETITAEPYVLVFATAPSR